MSEVRKLDTASAVAALLSEGDDRLVVTTEAKYIDVERDHERKGRLKPIKVERRDGTVDEVDVETVLVGLVRKNQVEALAENLPVCACCGEKVVPSKARVRRPGAAHLCEACPSCVCGRGLPIKSMDRHRIAERAGRRPTCVVCYRAPRAHVKHARRPRLRPRRLTCLTCGQRFDTRSASEVDRCTACRPAVESKSTTCDCGAQKTRGASVCQKCRATTKMGRPAEALCALCGTHLPDLAAKARRRGDPPSEWRCRSCNGKRRLAELARARGPRLPAAACACGAEIRSPKAIARARRGCLVKCGACAIAFRKSNGVGVPYMIEPTQDP